MSYRVDIPTLSANEVYTLTFEYEGTETIQLIVGDLTLETTDRRVVFTTTSPVNYIESNVNLINLNMYEGYYESDDFGGEYTQESIIEGKSLINLINVTDSDFPKQTGWYDFKINKNISDGKYYTLIVDVSDTSGGFDYGVINNQGTSYTYFSDTITTDGKYIVYRTFNGASQTIRFRGKTSDSPITINSLMLLEGDYSDGNVKHFTGIGCVKSPRVISREQPLNMFYCTNWTSTLNNGTVTCQDGKFYFDGSFGGYTYFDIINGGEVKNNIYLEPGRYYAKMKAHSKEPCVVSGTCVSLEATMENGITIDLCSVYTSKDKMYNQVTAQNKNFTSPIVKLTLKIWYGGNGSNNIIIDGIYIGKTNTTNDLAFKETNVITTPDDLELYCNYYYDRNAKKSSPCYQDTLDLTTGTITRKNIKVKLNDSIAKYGSVEGALVTVNGGDMVRVKYNHINSSSGAFPVQVEGEVIGASATGIVFSTSQGNYEGTWYPTGDIEHTHTSTTTIYMYFNPSRFDGIDYTDSTTIKNWLIEQDFTLIMKIHKSSAYTEQLSLNPLKSYRNGSIQTSSQQLIPTLKTTLPISNKFTTTNLTSGSTYNVYFDGTATKLDAGGTIITNPISPCEVECGGTTLTIEGTDIQNVRVIETTVKNEVSSVNGTTDVELKKMKTYKYENILDDIKYSTTVQNGAVININYDDFCIEFMGAHGWAGEFADTGLKYPTGCSLVHVEFDIDMDNPNLRMAINFNEGIYNSYPQHRHITLNNDTATIAQGNYDNIYTSIITKGHFSRLMYANGDRPIIINLYTGSYITGNLATGNSAEGSIDGYETIGSNYGRITNLKMRIIENFSSNYTTVTSVLRDSSYNIIWQDMDMTIPQTISNLEQPIKLRSLGTTYDGYNPVTGELIKRIGVSETDGSYSVLSSPIVENIIMGKPANLISENFPITIDSTKYKDFYFGAQQGTEYTIEFDIGVIGKETECGICRDGTITGVDWIANGKKSYTLGINKMVITTDMTHPIFFFRIRGENTVVNTLKIVKGNYENSDIPTYTQTIPHLYTNGQVKVYSDSEVYPTTILNGQSTNNYEISELNTSSNYTIRYDGECESINLAKKSNTQGTNRIVKAGATSGNLTFVNDSGDINNVLLVQNDVREQEIKHFNGLQTVEVSRILIENQRNMSSQHYTIENGSHYDYQRILPHYIKVEPNETLYANIGQNWMDWCTIYQYDEDKNRLSDIKVFGGYGTTQFKDSDGLYKNIITLSDNTRYIRIVLHNAFTSTFTLSKGDFLPPSTLAYNQYQGQYIDLPQPVQLNSLPNGTCDTYNPITGEYVQNVGVAIMDENGSYGNSWSNTGTAYPVSRCTGFTTGDMATRNSTVTNVLNNVHSANYGTAKDYEVKLCGYGDRNTNYRPVIDCGNLLTGGKNNVDGLKAYLKENPIILYYQLVTPIITQLTPINIPTFEGGIVQLITTDGKVFPMIEYSMPTNNRYDTSSWETGAVYTQRNMTEVYFNDSTTPMTPTETMTLTTDHISNGSIILNDNGNGLIVLKGNYIGRDIPYFTGMRSVEAIEVETTPSPDQPLFGKGGRK